MSGLVVAGIVLGGLPIIVLGLKFYLQGASTIREWRRYKRPLQQLITELETSHVIFQNVLEKLLLRIAGDDQIANMIRDPFGPAWKQPTIYHKVRERLWRSPKVFEDTIQDMGAAVAELRKSLQIDFDGKVTWADSSTLQREWKRVRFILQQDNYQNLLNKIRDGVFRLQSLMDLNVELQPERRRRSQGRVLKLAREISGSIYHAIRMALACSCPHPHDVGLGLKLLSKPESAIPEDSDEEIAKLFGFHLVTSYGSAPREGSDESTSRQWCEMALRISQECNISTSTPTSPKPATGVRFLTSLARSDRPSSTSIHLTPQLSQPATTIHSVGSTTITLTSMSTSASTTQSHGLSSYNNTSICQIMRSLGKRKVGECCGFIIDDSSFRRQKYALYPHGTFGDPCDWSLMSIRDVISSDPDSSHRLSYRDKLQLAFTLASSLSQLHGTPWLSEPPTHDTILVAKQAGVAKLNTAFVRKEMPEPVVPNLPTSMATADTKPWNLFALGVLLLEIILGEMVTEKAPGPSNQGVDLLRDRAMVTQLLNRVNTAGGPNYARAVRRCLEFGNCYINMTLGEEGYQKEISAVIGWLEDDLKAME